MDVDVVVVTIAACCALNNFNCQDFFMCESCHLNFFTPFVTSTIIIFFIFSLSWLLPRLESFQIKNELKSIKVQV